MDIHVEFIWIFLVVLGMMVDFWVYHQYLGKL